MIKRLADLFKGGTPDFSIIIIGIMSLSMGIWLLTPLGTFSSSEYGLLASTAPEWVWGVLMLIPGVLKITGTLLRKWTVARAGCWWGFLVWIFFSVSFFIEDPTSPISSLLFWKGILNGWYVIYIGAVIHGTVTEERV